MEEIVLLHQEYDYIHKIKTPIIEQIRNLEIQKNELEYHEFVIQQQIAKIDFSNEDAENEKNFPLDFENLKIEDLDSLPLSAFHHLTKEKYGIDIETLKTGDFYTDLSPKKYKEFLIQRIIANESCRYCHNINHLKDDCPVLKKKFCQRCNTYGHDNYHCPKHSRKAHRGNFTNLI